MQTVLIEVPNENALRLLQELEGLRVIRLLKSGKEEPKSAKNQSTSKKKASEFKGVLSSDLTNKMQENIKHSREGWGRI